MKRAKGKGADARGALAIGAVAEGWKRRSAGGLTLLLVTLIWSLASSASAVGPYPALGPCPVCG